MKTMTCRQLGGPCDLAHHGKDANEVIKAQDRHLKEIVANGDTAHEQALKEMEWEGRVEPLTPWSTLILRGAGVLVLASAILAFLI